MSADAGVLASFAHRVCPTTGLKVHDQADRLVKAHAVVATVTLLVGGIAAIAFLGSARKVDSLKATLLRLFDGLSSLTNITKMFGDVLSYLRLFALGLASASLAVTFNQLAGQVHDAVPGLGLLLSLLVLLLGHGINLGLGIVSGFVHGLRLNFIEFFNWGIEEEGPPFRAFAKKEIEP